MIGGTRRHASHSDRLCHRADIPSGPQSERSSPDDRNSRRSVPGVVRPFGVDEIKCYPLDGHLSDRSFTEE
jgi:hypothetical protein